MGLIAEFWVMRVVVHAPWAATLKTKEYVERSSVIASVRTGSYCILPMGYIAEPIEVYDSQAKATERALIEAAAHPEHDYRVVMNADPEGLAESPEAASS